MEESLKKPIKKHVHMEDDPDLLTQYFEAIERNNYSSLRSCLEQGLDPNSHISDNTTGLHIAANNGYVKLICILLKHPDIDINIQDSAGNTPLNLACKNNCKDIAVLLLKNNANGNIPDKNGYTPLHNAVLWKYMEIVKLLLKYRVKLDLENTFGKTPLYLALIDSPSFDIAELLIIYGADVNLNNGKTMPLLLECCFICNSYSHLEMVLLLLDSDADVNIRDYETNRTALHIAALVGYKPLVKLLLKRGANLTVQDYQGITPLQMAIRHIHYKIVKILLTAIREERARNEVVEEVQEETRAENGEESESEKQ